MAVAVVTLTQAGVDDKYLLLQRPKEGLLAGKHTMPACHTCRNSIDCFSVALSECFYTEVTVTASHRCGHAADNMNFDAVAGLWEFPAVKVPADASKARSGCEVDRLLEGPLGMPLAAEHVVSRKGLGTVVHIFSHIRMTMRAEHIVLTVCVSRLPLFSRCLIALPHLHVSVQCKLLCCSCRETSRLRTGWPVKMARMLPSGGSPSNSLSRKAYHLA